MIYTPKTTAGKGRPLRVFVNGKEIYSSFYLDRRRRVLKTFDVRDDGTVATATAHCPFAIDPSWDAPIDGVLSKKILLHHRDRIELKEMR